MATANLEEIVEQLSNLKVVDLANLKKLLEEKWDVIAAAPVAAVAAPAAGGEAAPAAAEAPPVVAAEAEVEAEVEVEA